MIGAIVVTEAANNRIGLLDLHTDREGMVAEQPRQRIKVFPNRLPTRSHQELRGSQPFEGSANEVKTIRITYYPCFLFA